MITRSKARERMLLAQGIELRSGYAVIAFAFESMAVLIPSLPGDAEQVDKIGRRPTVLLQSKFYVQEGVADFFGSRVRKVDRMGIDFS
ncbi:hypothetical protein O206_11135 [Ochrobactrum sp. EGD-AQ16]|nr:hypothetical protein O206_11135 [Ochrobactrum sp. EGD-AQ16]